MEHAFGTIEQPEVLPIADIKQENERVRTFYFDKAMKSQPGQFVIVWIPRLDEKPFSIASEENGRLGLAIAKVGAFTEKLFTMKKGEQIGLRGPYGSWFTTENDYKKILLIGGGYGVAPLSFLAQQAKKQDITIDFCNGARTSDQILFKDKLHKLNINLHITTNDGSDGQTGTVLDSTNECLNKNKYDCVYVCGPEVMEKKVAEQCDKLGVPCQVSIERYMKCGFGICGQCCLDDSGARMCKEGPVVWGDYALKQKEFGHYHRTKSGKIEKTNVQH